MTATVALLERLIGFDTQSFRSNLELVDFVRDHLAALGLEMLLVPDDTGEKANLWAVIGPRDVPGIVFSGHTDVVPVAGLALVTVDQTHERGLADEACVGLGQLRQNRIDQPRHALAADLLVVGERQNRRPA